MIGANLASDDNKSCPYDGVVRNEYESQHVRGKNGDNCGDALKQQYHNVRKEA